MTTDRLKTKLWTPPNPQQTQIYHFAESVKARHGFDWGGDYERLWQWSVDHLAEFWSELWDWHGVVGEKGEQIFINATKMREARFFPEARLNYAENMLYEAGDSEGNSEGDSESFVAYGEDGRCCRLTRAEIKHKALCLAGWMRAQGVEMGDRVAAYVPNSEIALICMLASASIGAIFSSCSPEFGRIGVQDRFGQITPKILFSVDGYLYQNKRIDRRGILAELAQRIASIEKIVVAGYLDTDPDIGGIRGAVAFETCLRHEPIQNFQRVAFNHPLYILYSSGTTGAPKCILHSTGGTLMQHIKEHRLHSDLSARDTIFYFTTCGWMMWNWLVSAMMVRAKIVTYEGHPFYPSHDRLWQMAETEKLTVFGTSAKYIDAVRQAGIKPAQTHDLTALRLMHSTGSPLSAEGFDFVYTHIKADIQLASISGGTDIIGCFVLGCPVKPVYAGEIQARGLGMHVVFLNEAGQAVEGEQGELCCLSPFPSMPVGFWHDETGQLYHDAYFGVYDNVWRHGDWASLTAHKGVIIHGRSDATLNPAGVRIGTAEIYRIVESFEEIAEGLVVGQTIDTDMRIILFVRMAEGFALNDALKKQIKARLKTQASPRHVPAVICAVQDMPRTYSGKITELAVRDILHGRAVKNTHALANPESLQEFQNREELEI